MLDLNFRQTAQPVRKLWPRPWEFTASFDLLRVFCVRAISARLRSVWI